MNPRPISTQPQIKFNQDIKFEPGRVGLIALGLAAIDGRLVHMVAHDRSDG